MKLIIETKNAPAPLGPYNQAVLKNDTLYASGQIALNIETGNLVTDNIRDETQQVMKNLKAVLTAAEMTFENVVKSTIFITDMNNFGDINSVYGSYFDEAIAPARETVQVTALPKYVNVEISVIAVR